MMAAQRVVFKAEMARVIRCLQLAQENAPTERHKWWVGVISRIAQRLFDQADIELQNAIPPAEISGP